MKLLLKNFLQISLIVFVFFDFIESLKIKSGAKSQTQNHSKVKFSSTLKSQLMSLNTNKALMDSYFKMKSMMKAHSQTISQSKSNSVGLLGYMSYFNTIGTKKSSPFKTRQRSEKKLYNDSINSFSFKSLAKTMESEYGDAAKGQDANKGSGGNSTSANGTGETLEDWWMIKATELRDGSKYPILQLANNTIARIKVNHEGYRVNDCINCNSSKPENDTLFYFRLNDEGLFYASTKTDINVLSYLPFETVDDSVKLYGMANKTHTKCIKLNDRQNKGWEICNNKDEVYNKWLCKIKKILDEDDEPGCRNNKTENGTLNATKTVIKVQPEVVIPLPSRDCNQFWNYNQNGKDWECICKEGVEQSPIDLPPITDAIDSPIKPLFEYKEISALSEYSTLDKIMEFDEPITFNHENGHLIIEHEDLGKIVTLDGAVYKAEEINFHTPSNHKINGKSFPLEVSIVHYGISKGDISNQIVLSFLFEKKAGVSNKFLDDLDYYDLPNPMFKQANITKSLFIPKILYEATSEDLVVMKPFSFYTYQGSLMFPPCTERTIHYVSSKPLRIGTSMLQLFQEALRAPDVIKSTGSKTTIKVSSDLPVSNRDIQELNGRPVFHYDHTKYCFINEDKPKPKPVGHYEKMKRDVEKIFYVSGNRPSGIPGAFVVPTEEVEGS